MFPKMYSRDKSANLVIPFHYPGWLVGIFIHTVMACYNPRIIKCSIITYKGMVFQLPIEEPPKRRPSVEQASAMKIAKAAKLEHDFMDDMVGVLGFLGGRGRMVEQGS